LGRDAELAKRGNHRRFQGVDIAADGEPVVVEADDGVGDELPGRVEGDVAAAVGGDDVDAAGRQHFRRGDDVALDAGPAAERDHGRVLDEQDPLLAAGQHLLVGALLHRPRLSVRHPAEILDPHGGL
jgi:hypothetical protein